MKYINKSCGIGKFIFFVIVLAFLAEMIYSNRYLQVTQYKVVSEKTTKEIRVLQLSDLHDSQFGSGNWRLIKKVEKLHPDVILFTGDLVTSADENYQTALGLIHELKAIAPVYISLGNHEVDYMKRFPENNLKKLFTEAGATVLDFAYKNVTLKGIPVRIGGLYGFCYAPDSGADIPKETDFLEKFQETDRLTLLMCHLPVVWMETDSLDKWNIDFVFTGHAHGGQIRLPVVGGLYAPDQGFFVGREEGLYFSENKKHVMVLSRGLGSDILPTRFNNPPQIVMLDIVPGS